MVYKTIMSSAVPRNFLLFPILLFALVPPASAVQLPRENDKWFELRVEGFRIFSNGGERSAKQVARDLQMMRAVIGKVTNLKVRTPITTNVYVFRNEASFAPYRDAIFGSSGKNASGVFLGHPDGNYIAIDGTAQTHGVVYHELIHFFLNNTTADTPLWMNEGLAEFYSTFKTLGDDVLIGQPVEAHVRALRQYRLIPLGELLSITQESKDYNEGTRQGIYYAQTWALVHYLLVGSNERKGQLATFGRYLNEGRHVDAAFQQAFNTTYQKMEGELQRYISNSRFQYLSYELAELPRTVPDTVLMSRDDVLFVLGDLLTHSSRRNFPDAEILLSAALAINAEHSGANATLGYIREIDGHLKEATDFYDRAVAGGSSDFVAYLLAGEHLIRLAAASPQTSAGLAQRARALFQKATQMNPSMPRAWAGLGSTYLFDGDAAAGVRALEKSWSMAPSQMDVAHNIVVLYARLGDRESANRWIDQVLVKSNDQTMVTSAREAMLISDLRRAEDLLKSGKSDEAERVLNHILANSANPGLRSTVQGQLNLMKRVEEHRHDVQRYNEAIEFANRQDFKSALPILEEVIAQSRDEDLVASAREVREKIMAINRKKRER